MPVPLTRAAKGKAAPQLPDPFPALARSRYHPHFRRGQVVMVAGPPGAGKSMFALIGALNMKVPTLYISADSDEDTMAARAAAALTKHPVRDVEQTIEYGLFNDQYGGLFTNIPIRFEYDPPDPTMQDISHAITAWQEVWGEPPHMLVVDNLMNMSGPDANEWQQMRQSVKDLHWIARKTKTCVVVLHHTSEQDKDQIESAPPRSAIQGKVSQLPALILTVANKDGEMFVGVVKNRHGPADPHAREPFRMVADFTNCQIYDKRLSEELYGWRGYQ